MKGPVRWSELRSPEGEGTDLSSVLRKLAHLTEYSLTSIFDAWPKFTGDMRAVAPPDAPTSMLPACAMPIGVIYDANEIHLVAHIAYTTHGTRRFLSLLFDTLPFPRNCTGLPRDFVRARYRVALALLSLQQHVFRMVTLAESFAGAPVELGPTQESTFRTRLEQLGWKQETPTPSSPCTSGSNDPEASHPEAPRLSNVNESDGEERPVFNCAGSRLTGYDYHSLDPPLCTD